MLSGQRPEGGHKPRKISQGSLPTSSKVTGGENLTAAFDDEDKRSTTSMKTQLGTRKVQRTERERNRKAAFPEAVPLVGSRYFEFCQMCMQEIPCLCNTSLDPRSSSGTSAATARWVINSPPSLIIPQSLDSGGMQTVDGEPSDCTGDSANYPVCADGSAGQAFCAAVAITRGSDREEGMLVRPLTPMDLPEEATSQLQEHTGFAGNARLRASSRSFSSPRMRISHLCEGGFKVSGDGGDAKPSSGEKGDLKDSYIPSNVAWKQLKAHPEIQNGNFDLLAEVVAQLEYVPASSGPSTGTSAPSGFSRSSWGSRNTATNTSNTLSIDSSRLLVPYQELLDHDKQRRGITRVPQQDVDEALLLLDGLKNLL